MSKVTLYKLPDNELAIKFRLLPEHIAVVKELQRRREQLGDSANWRPLWEQYNRGSSSLPHAEDQQVFNQ
jgi:hypothetical protein